MAQLSLNRATPLQNNNFSSYDVVWRTGGWHEAKALGLDVPAALPALADQVIE